MSYFITTDATCDFPQELLNNFTNFKIIPMTYTIDDIEYGIDKQLSGKEFYDKVRNGAMPTTSLITTYTATEFFRPILEDGNDILHICFSSSLSNTYQSVTLAVEELKKEFPNRKIFILDSKAACSGEALLVYYSLKARDNGMDIESNYNETVKRRDHICHYFTPNDLYHLMRGGRVSKTAAVAGTLLQIKPMLYANVDGKLSTIGKVKGRKKALLGLVEYMQDKMIADKNEIIFIAHADCLEDAEFVKEKIIEKTGLTNIIIDYIGPVIGSHTGQGTVALFFVGKDKIEATDDLLKQ